jgi:hypothetical protein
VGISGLKKLKKTFKIKKKFFLRNNNKIKQKSGHITHFLIYAFCSSRQKLLCQLRNLVY